MKKMRNEMNQRAKMRNKMGGNESKRWEKEKNIRIEMVHNANKTK